PALPGVREPRVTAPTGRHSAHRAASTVAALRPALLGPAVPALERLGRCRLRGPTRHRDPVAADWLPSFLDLEEPPERTGPPGRRPGGPRADPSHVWRQPLLGCAALNPCPFLARRSGRRVGRPWPTGRRPRGSPARGAGRGAR